MCISSVWTLVQLHVRVNVYSPFYLILLTAVFSNVSVISTLCWKTACCVCVDASCIVDFSLSDFCLWFSHSCSDGNKGLFIVWYMFLRQVIFTVVRQINHTFFLKLNLDQRSLVRNQRANGFLLAKHYSNERMSDLFMSLKTKVEDRIIISLNNEKRPRCHGLGNFLQANWHISVKWRHLKHWFLVWQDLECQKSAKVSGRKLWSCIRLVGPWEQFPDVWRCHDNLLKQLYCFGSLEPLKLLSIGGVQKKSLLGFFAQVSEGPHQVLVFPPPVHYSYMSRVSRIYIYIY